MYSYQIIFQLLLMNYLALMIVSCIIASAQYWMSKHPLALLGALYWFSLIAGGMTQGIAQNDPVLAGFAMLCSTPSAYLLLRINERVFAASINWKTYWSFWLAMSLIGSGAIVAGYRFEIYAIFFSLAVAMPVTLNLLQHLPRFKSFGVSRGLYWLASFVCIANLYSYPWLRLENQYQMPVFLFSFWNGFFTAVSLPLVLLEAIKSKDAENLEIRIEETSRDLRFKNEQLSRAETEKTNLLRLVSHDIANLVMIADHSAKRMIKKCEEYLRGPEADAVHVYYSKLASSISHQTELVRNIRDFLLVTQKKSYLNLGPVSLVAAIREVLEFNQPRIEKKMLRTVFKIPDEDVFVVADKTTLVTSVLNNFMTNAIKFSFEGGCVTISVALSGDAVDFCIQDEGVGISHQALKQAEMSSTPGTAGEAGTGFGLSIARHFCEAYGALLRIESQARQDGCNASFTRIHIRFQKA